MTKPAARTHPLALCASDLVALVEDGLMTREEARSLLGLDPDEPADAHAPLPSDSPRALVTHATRAEGRASVLVKIPRAFLLEAQAILAAALDTPVGASTTKK